MAQTPESKVKAQIRAILDRAGVYYAMPMGTGYGNSGTPDFLCCVDGYFLAIEAKTRLGHLTALQKRTLEKIKGTGGVTMVVNEDNLDDLRSVVNGLKDQK